MAIVTYSELAIKGIFVLVFLIATFVSMDIGIFAASSLQIKESLALDNLQFGAMQTLVFLGIIFGKLFLRNL